MDSNCLTLHSTTVKVLLFVPSICITYYIPIANSTFSTLKQEFLALVVKNNTTKIWPELEKASTCEFSTQICLEI